MYLLQKLHDKQPVGSLHNGGHYVQKGQTSSSSDTTNHIACSHSIPRWPPGPLGHTPVTATQCPQVIWLYISAVILSSVWMHTRHGGIVWSWPHLEALWRALPGWPLGPGGRHSVPFITAHHLLAPVIKGACVCHSRLCWGLSAHVALSLIPCSHETMLYWPHFYICHGSPQPPTHVCPCGLLYRNLWCNLSPSLVV